MTKKEYREYEQAVADFFEREGIQHLSSGRITCVECGANLHEDGCCDEACPKCGASYDMMNESHFSWSPCDCCQRPLGGDRYPANGYRPPDEGETKGECLEYNICTDCVYYAEYGRLDDTTMMNIEDSEE